MSMDELPQNVAAFLNVVFQVIVVMAFIGQLSQPQFLRREVLVQVELVQCGRLGFPQTRGEHCRLHTVDEMRRRGGYVR